MTDLRLGLKLFSNQFEQYKEEAINIINQGYANYIELFVYPDSFDCLKDWEKLKNKYDIKFTIHSPHSSQNVNLVVPELFDYNKKIYSQMDIFMDALDAEYMIVHSGRKGSIKETVRQLNLIKPKRMMIENTPYFSPKLPDIVAAGGTVEEIKYVLDNHDCGFCFDVGHAFCSAIALNIEPYTYMEKFLELKPNCYHLSDGEINNKIDKHFHIGKGDYDWKKILSKIDVSKNLTLETITKNYSDTLMNNFVEDTKILRGLC
jgi:sugar phosphate isomerase/epimerase